MRLHYGAVPKNKEFNPESEGWYGIREPGPIALQFLAIPVFLLLLVFWVVCLLSVQSDPSPFQGRRIDHNTLLIFVLLLPVHELLHILIHPNWGTSSNSMIGVWPSKGLLYAHYEGEMSRDRFLFVFVMPLLVLGILPTLLLMMIPELLPSLFWLSLFGTVMACGDLVGVAFIVFQVPRSATIRNKGWNTYWKSAQ